MDKYIDDRLQKLQNSDKKVRCAVISAFGRVKQNKEKVIAPLINVLADPDDDVYRAAFNSLVKLGEVVVEPVIEEALKNENPLVRYRAIFIFDKIRDKGAIAPLINLLNEDEDSDVRAAAAGVLAGLPQDSQIGEALITALKDKDSAVRYHSAISLGILRISEAVPLLIRLLKDQDERVRGHCAYALGQCGGSEVVEPLLPLLEDESASVRMWATSALARKDDGRVINPLIKRLEDKDRRVREAAIGSLISLQGIEGINRAVQPLIRLLLNDESSNIRSMVAQALEELGDKGL